MLAMHPCDFTNNPHIIARNDRMAAVNAALAVDLMGQVAADTLPSCGTPYSGIGGQARGRGQHGCRGGSGAGGGFQCHQQHSRS